MFYINHLSNIELINDLYKQKIEYVQEIARIEQDWIISNIDENGVIYMNYSDSKSKDVNPYFSCLALESLLYGENHKSNLDYIKKYILWHRDKFLKEQGEISNYRMKEDYLVSTKNNDSVDSYIAMYLNLISKYVDSGGDLKEIDANGEIIDLSLDKLEKLIRYGLTAVRAEKEIYYYMDNIEVKYSLINLKNTLISYGNLYYVSEMNIGFINRIDKIVSDIDISIEENLWNENENRYEIGLSNNKSVFKFNGWKNLYPDSIVQIYKLAFENKNNITSRDLMLYREFCKYQPWETVVYKDDFMWNSILYISSNVGDLERSEIYLKNYIEEVNKSRGYPFYITEAAWVLKACYRLEEKYIEIIDRNVYEDIFFFVKEIINDFKK